MDVAVPSGDEDGGHPGPDHVGPMDDDGLGRRPRAVGGAHHRDGSPHRQWMGGDGHGGTPVCNGVGPSPVSRLLALRLLPADAPGPILGGQEGPDQSRLVAPGRGMTTVWGTRTLVLPAVLGPLGDPRRRRQRHRCRADAPPSAPPSAARRRRVGNGPEGWGTSSDGSPGPTPPLPVSFSPTTRAGMAQWPGAASSWRIRWMVWRLTRTTSTPGSVIRRRSRQATASVTGRKRVPVW